MNLVEFNDFDEVIWVEIEGFRIGIYVRLEIYDVFYEMVEYFDFCYFIFVGGFSFGEENVGCM